MRKTKTIEVSGEELIAAFLDMTTSEFIKSGIKTDSENIEWDIKEEGDYDRGTYKRYVTGLTITIEE